MMARRERGSRRASFAARRLILLAVLVVFLVVPVVAVALNAFSSQSQSTQSPLVCSVATDPCQLPPSAVSP
jgi:ABC-type spermidine/putrescine transport system permease subunit II